MTRAQRIQIRVSEFFADDEAPDSIAPEDTLYHNLANPFPDGRLVVCPTCSRELVPGFRNPHMLQCPGCMTDIDLARGKYSYTTRAGNMSKGQYD